MGDNNGIKVKDLVCGMLVDLGKRPKSVEYRGEQLYFCSDFCLDRFKQKPQAYLVSKGH